MAKDDLYCLNCDERIKVEEQIMVKEAQNPPDYSYKFVKNEDRITTCRNCNWRNQLKETPIIESIIIKKKTLEDNSVQICYPMISMADLKYLPESLKNAVISYFKDADNFSKKDYQNIYHNLFSKNAREFRKIGMKYIQKAKLAEFFQNTNFTNLSWSEKLLKTMDRPIGLWKRRIDDHVSLEIFEIEPLLENENSEALEEYFREYKIEVMDYWDFVDSPRMEEWKHDYLWYSERYHNVLEKEASEWMKENGKQLEREDFDSFFRMIKKEGEVWIDTSQARYYVIDECYDWSVEADSVLESSSKNYQDEISYQLEEQEINEREVEY